jgi:hypothetical protein
MKSAYGIRFFGWCSVRSAWSAVCRRTPPSEILPANRNGPRYLKLGGDKVSVCGDHRRRTASREARQA